MTRHGMVKTSAAGALSSATAPHASVVIIAANKVAASRRPRWERRADAQPNDLSASITLLSGCSRATAQISRRSKSP